MGDQTVLVTIDVVGPTRSGKTSIASIIATALKKAGFDHVMVEDPDGFSPSPEHVRFACEGLGGKVNIRVVQKRKSTD